MSNRFQLEASAVEAYEAQKVTSIFAPLAEATLEQVHVSESDRVLDVACGTGIVARTLNKQYPWAIDVAGVDLNEMMIEKARAMTNGLAGRFEWYVSDASSIPVEDASFSIVFCQQALQYFPDDAAALSEMRRVLLPDGRLALSLWAPANDYFLAQAEALKKHVSIDAATKALAPFSYPGEERVPDLLTKLGFKNIQSSILIVDRVIPNAADGIREDILGSPLGPLVKQKGRLAMDAVVQEIIGTCSGYIADGNLVIAQHSNLFQATLRPKSV